MINTCKLRDALNGANHGGPGAYPQCSPAFSTVMAFTALVQALVLRKTQSPRPSLTLDRQSYDFIVVGAGAAGAVVAARLVEADYRVLLLEAGGEEPQEADEIGTHSYLMGSSLDWQYRTQPEPQNCAGRGCSYPRGKALGGGTAINSMMYVRGNPRDYDAWRDAGNEGWGWDDVLPYFLRYEDNRDSLISFDKRHHATGGPQSVQRFPTTDINAKIMFDAYGELGYPQVLLGGSGDHEHRKGVFMLQFTSRDGARQSTNRAYLEPLRRRSKKLRIVTRARVTKVILDKDLTARGVQFMDDASNGTGRALTVFATKEVILSAGAVNSPQLLQLSGIGPRAVLERAGIRQVLELPVGLNLQDHTTGDTFDMLLTKTGSVPDGPDGWVSAQREYNLKQNGPMATVSVMTTYAFAATNYTTDEYPDIEITLGPLVSSPPCASTLEDASRCANQRFNLSCQVVSYPFYNGVAVASSILRPRSRGNITVASADPFAAPLININFLDDPRDVDVLVQANLLAFQLANTRAVRDNGYLVNTTPVPPCDKHPYASEERIRCALREFGRSNYHTCCTCKMAPDGDPTAVVDQRLRVRGVRHLRVVDASIMPTITSGNTVAPTIMIGEKGVAMIIEDWRS